MTAGCLRLLDATTYADTVSILLEKSRFRFQGAKPSNYARREMQNDYTCRGNVRRERAQFDEFLPISAQHPRLFA